ncbi:MAG: PadR family transcriptional regulator [Alphaproteobacteria bacterium]
MDTKTLCLGIISLGAASGYEIKKAFEEDGLNHIYHTSYGSIYPALTALTKEGLADCAEMAQEKRPDKKVYSITETGRNALLEALSAPPADDKFRSDFLFIMFFAQLLPPPHVEKLIDERIAWYEKNIAKMESGQDCICSKGDAFVHGMGLAVYRSAADYLKSHRQELLDQLSDANRLVAE